MDNIITRWEAIRDFIEMGGPVLNWIAAVIFLMWILIIERTIYMATGHRKQVNQVMGDWEARKERDSWAAKQIRIAMISRVKDAVNGSIPMIKTLVALCPLLGLLGTVTGMIDVFDVMAVSGTGNARSMAAGVSKATVPTMAGMVGALSGVFASTFLTRKADTEVERLRDNLTMDH